MAWVLFFCLPLLLHPPFNSHLFPEPNLHPPRFDLYHTISDLLLVGIFYLNVYSFLPYLLNKKRTGRFLVIQLLMFLGFAFMNSFLFRELIGFDPMIYATPPQSLHGHGAAPINIFFISQKPSLASYLFSVRDIFPFILIFATSLAYRMVIDRIRTDRLAKEKENENLKTELLLLRSQINPHFVFNVLNNMVSLARKQSDQLEPSLIKLSALMRYMYFDATEDKVLLSREIDYIKSYIDIQEQRFMGSVTVKADLARETGNYVIEPMLLIPFVENAFKHGTGLIEDAEIDINLRLVDDELLFFVSNKFNQDTIEEKDKTKGIGLTNVRRRLTLLYGDRHQLDIQVSENLHTVSLQLNLN